MINVLGIDPGFAKLGVARIVVDPDHGDCLIELQVFKTQPSPKKQKILAMDDNLRRICELVDGVKSYIEWADVVCTESFSPPRHASAAAKIAFAWGAVAALCRSLDKPILQCSPQHLKKAMTGSRSASKADIKAAVDRAFGEATAVDLLEQNSIVPSNEEHCYDAAAAVLACLDSATVKLLLAGAKARKEPRDEDVHKTNQLRLRTSVAKPRGKVRTRSRPSRRSRDHSGS